MATKPDIKAAKADVPAPAAFVAPTQSVVAPSIPTPEPTPIPAHVPGVRRISLRESRQLRR